MLSIGSSSSPSDAASAFAAEDVSEPGCDGPILTPSIVGDHESEVAEHEVSGPIMGTVNSFRHTSHDLLSNTCRGRPH